MRKLVLGLVLASSFAYPTLSSAEVPADPTNRLTDMHGNRCGENQIPVARCPGYQEFAWNGGSGCINATEYNYAKVNSIAPMCDTLFDRTSYIGWCRCGCFERSTRVFVQDAASTAAQWVPVDTLPNQEFKLGIYTLATGATLQNPSRTVHAILDTTVGPEEKPLIYIRTEGGAVLGLTEQHAVLLSTGHMVRAVELTPDSLLVNMNGGLERIVELWRAPTPDPVFNMLTDAGLENKMGHLVFAEGIIVGDIYWQNIIDDELRQTEIRK